ncbi:MAG TPA: transglycosylase SLT domain-containing protein, partial [Amaricoccus sp.]|nr:transglycosylase SLT domain-containing protein [Amaricoccus sp.]
MRMGRVILALALAGALPAAAETAAPTDATLVVAALEPMPRRGLCIWLSSYVPDVCGAIEAAARQNGLDPNFFVRLIWKESLFDAAAVSPAGAQGIAQFMPGTAELRGLDDPFNP